MADRRNSDSNREAMLRRVAIVLSSLPAHVAAQLLGSVDAQTKQAVRRTMTSLSDVDPLERRRALSAFKVSVENPPTSTRSDVASAANDGTNRIEDEVALSTAAETPHVGSRVVSSPVSVARPEESLPLSFLGDVQDDTLVSLLASEHPQAVALVLASIAPAQAARVLPRLDQRVRTDALARIGRLDNIPEAAVAEIAEHFRTRLAKSGSDGRNATGQRALDAILAAMPTPVASEAAPADMPPDGVAAGASPVAPPAQESSPPSTAAAGFPSADVPAIDLAHRMRAVDQSLQESDSEAGRDGESTAPRHRTSQPSVPTQDEVDPSTDRVDGDTPLNQTATHEGPRAFESTDDINRHLLNLPPTQLCQALGMVGTRDALLALCGLPNQVAESVLAILPRGHAKQVRTQMATLNTLHLREIDDAKEKVAVASLPVGDPVMRPVPVAA